MKSLMFSLIFVLSAFCYPRLAYAQNNSCSGAEPIGNVANPKELSTLLPEFNLTDPNKQPLVTEFQFEVRNGTTIVQSFILSKSSFIVQTGTPANCYKFTFPSITQPINENQAYQVALRAGRNNVFGEARVSSNGFFLQGAPSAPVSLRLAIINMLSKMWDKVLSTTSSKPWFKPIGR